MLLDHDGNRKLKGNVRAGDCSINMKGPCKIKGPCNDGRSAGAQDIRRIADGAIDRPFEDTLADRSSKWTFLNNPPVHDLHPHC